MPPPPQDPMPPLPTLPMQLMLSLGCWLSSPFALAYAKNGWPSLNNDTGSGPQEIDALQKAVAAEAKSRAESLLEGILRYYDMPCAPKAPAAPCIWRRGNARLLDYGSVDRDSRDHRETRQPRTTTSTIVLFIPSLINRYYILDLEKKRSMLRFLAAEGIYPLVLDWGEPGAFEHSFGCADYITEILCPAIDFIAGAAHQRIILAGYCMGGNLALAAAQVNPKNVAALALLATPWDFHCKEFLPFVLDKQWLPMIEAFLARQKTLPAEIIQSLFYLTDPFIFEHKFRRFSTLSPESREAEEFIALERWVNDGVPMTAKTAYDCLIGWAQKNELARGEWRVAAKKIHPSEVTLPVLIALPENDHVVPRDCASPLASAMPHADIIYPSAGHVGMIVGSQARKELWKSLAEWAQAIS